MASVNQKQNQTIPVESNINVHEDYKQLTTHGIQKAKECIDFLKFSDGLVRRDIDLIRMQLEIKLKKLESRLQAELRNIVETETSKLEKFIKDATSIKDSSAESKSKEMLSTLKTFANGMERKRLKFEANVILEKSLDEIKSFGKIVVEKVDSEKSRNVDKLRNENKGKIEIRNGYKWTLSDSSAMLSSRLETPLISSQQRNVQLQPSLGGSKSITFNGHTDDRNDHNEIETESEKTVSNRIIDKVTSSMATHTDINKYQSRVQLHQEKIRKVTNEGSCSHVKDNNDKDVSEWMHADPMSVLRALKQQTSRTEENLRALRDSKSDITSKTFVADANNQGKLDRKIGATKTDSKPNTDNKNSCAANKCNTLNEKHRNDEVINANGQDSEGEEFFNMDRVSRANEIWFGRDRRKSREDFNYRRTRSLSPKTVRFRLEDKAHTVNERLGSVVTDDHNVFDAARLSNGYKSDPAAKTDDTKNPNTNKTSPASQQTCNSNRLEERRQKLRDKRRRNNTISVITANDIAIFSFETNSKEIPDGAFTEKNYDIDADITSKSSESDLRPLTVNRTATSNHLNNQLTYLKSGPRLRIHSEDSTLSRHKTKHNSGTYIDFQKQLLSHDLHNSKGAKHKLDRQKLPSFREMLFSD